MLVLIFLLGLGLRR